VAVLAPKANFDSVYADVGRGTLSEVPHVIFFGLGEPKLLQLQNFGGGFVVFFLRGPKSQLRKS